MHSAGRTARVTHPILRLRVVSADGTELGSERVFCRLRRESVPLELCTSCPRLEAVKDGLTPSIDCAIPCVPHLDRLDPEGEMTEVGTMIANGTTVVDAFAPLRRARRLLQEERWLSVAVVDEEKRLIGIVHELTLLRPSCEVPNPLEARDDPEEVSVMSAMSTATPIHERMTIRSALRLLAGSHLREAVVVNPERKPIGIFRDVDGLRWIGRAQRGAADAAICETWPRRTV
jgi:CBS domain-containing protein